jgi:hypothetical protein
MLFIMSSHGISENVRIVVFVNVCYDFCAYCVLLMFALLVTVLES